MSYANAKIIKNSLFLKIEQGVPHTIRLLDADPTEQFQHKIAEKLTPCSGELCAHCDEGHSRNQRFVTNVYDYNDETVKLWSYGPTLAEDLKSIAIALTKDDMDIMNTDLEVTATGSGMQKKTKIQPRMKSQELPKNLKVHQIKVGKAADEIPF